MHRINCGVECGMELSCLFNVHHPFSTSMRPIQKFVLQFFFFTLFKLSMCPYPIPTECKFYVLVTQSCPTLSDPMNCSPPGSSVSGILQARILEWVAIPFSRGSSQPRDWTWVSCIAGRFFTIWATREAQALGELRIFACFVQCCILSVHHIF